MNFRWINPNSSGKIDVAIADYGITFYIGAIEEMGYPEAIRLGIDEENKILGVAPCNKEAENSIPFKEKINQNGNFVRISNKNVIKYIENRLGYGFKIESKSQKYNTKWDKDMQMLLIYLTQPVE